MFREIERLVPGDRVEITNLWETLSYEVVKCIVIYPDDTDAVKIIPGEDMVTLVTCHPYTENYQRYVVYCVRTDGSGEEASGAEGNGADKNTVEENATPGAAQTWSFPATPTGDRCACRWPAPCLPQMRGFCPGTQMESIPRGGLRWWSAGAWATAPPSPACGTGRSWWWSNWGMEPEQSLHVGGGLCAAPWLFLSL